MSEGYRIQLSDPMGRLVDFRLAQDPKSNAPLWLASLLDPVQPSAQVGEASYASLLTRFSGIYVQEDLSDGVGKKVQVPSSHAQAKRYYYAERIDASVPGQIQKGPQVTTLTAPANSGTLRGGFVLGTTLYLNLSRIIVSWDGATTLTQVRDMGASGVAAGAVVMDRLGAEASIEADTSDTATDTLTSADHRIAQQVRPDETDVRFLGRVDVKLIRSGTVTGDVRLSIMADKGGKPSNVIITSARILAANISTSATVYSFRFDDDDVYPVVGGEPFWLVLDAAAAGAATTIGWRRGSTNSYSRGDSATSSEAGNAWTTSAAQDYYFDVFAKTPTATAFVGSDDATNMFAISTNGTSYTADDYRTGALFAVVNDTLVRDVRGKGAIVTSTDGLNWGEPIVLGDPSAAVTELLVLNNVLLACKTDSVWAVDLVGTADSLPLLTSNPVATNGQGGTVWKGAAYIPWSGELVAIAGDFAAGFTVDTTVGPESLPEWDAPMGAGRVVAVAGDRFHLYAAMSATSGYRLFKSSDPMNAKWHGSLATLGDGTQTIQKLVVYEPGGTSNPSLFFTTTSNNVGRIILPRTSNPASDSNYRYDIASTGNLYYPQAHGNFPVDSKPWLTESVVFVETTSGDYAEFMYDTLDGDGWRYLGEPVYDTARLTYPQGLSSRLLARRLLLTTTAATASPVLLASGLNFATRLLRRLFQATVLLEDRPEALLAVTRDQQSSLLFGAVGAGTRTLVDPWGNEYTNVLVTNVRETPDTLRQWSQGASIQIEAVEVS